MTLVQKPTRGYNSLIIKWKELRQLPCFVFLYTQCHNVLLFSIYNALLNREQIKPVMKCICALSHCIHLEVSMGGESGLENLSVNPINNFSKRLPSLPDRSLQDQRLFYTLCKKPIKVTESSKNTAHQMNGASEIIICWTFSSSLPSQHSQCLSCTSPCS